MNFSDLGERIERVCAHRLALPAFSVAFLAGILIWPGVDATNVAISYLTIVLLLLTVDRDRRDRAAVHAKLDDLEIAVPEADSDKARLEDEPEDSIEEKRR